MFPGDVAVGKGGKVKKSKKHSINYRLQYLKLIYEVTKYRIAGKCPPAHLLEKVRKIEPLAKVSIRI
jgi:hypothetical protein